MIELEHKEMQVRPAFWTALYTGLAAPASLFAAPAPYAAHTVQLGMSQNFAIVASYFGGAVIGEISGDGKRYTRDA